VKGSIMTTLRDIWRGASRSEALVVATSSGPKGEKAKSCKGLFQVRDPET
jgi:hypothetical protein